MLRVLYAWTIALAQSPNALWALAIAPERLSNCKARAASVVSSLLGLRPCAVLRVKSGHSSIGLKTRLTPPNQRFNGSVCGRCGGMVDAGDSKSPDSNIVRVRVSPSAPIFQTVNSGETSKFGHVACIFTGTNKQFASYLMIVHGSGTRRS